MFVQLDHNEKLEEIKIEIEEYIMKRFLRI